MFPLWLVAKDRSILAVTQSHSHTATLHTAPQPHNPTATQPVSRAVTQPHSHSAIQPPSTQVHSHAPHLSFLPPPSHRPEEPEQQWLAGQLAPCPLGTLWSLASAFSWWRSPPSSSHPWPPPTRPKLQRLSPAMPTWQPTWRPTTAAPLKHLGGGELLASPHLCPGSFAQSSSDRRSRRQCRSTR